MTPHRFLWTLLSYSAGSVHAGGLLPLHSVHGGLPRSDRWPCEQQVWDLAAAQGVVPTLGHALLNLGLPSHWRADWQVGVQANTSASLQRLARATALQQRVPDLVWMKGVFLAQQAYPALGARRLGNDDDCLGTVNSLSTLLREQWQPGFPGHGKATSEQVIAGWSIGQEIGLVDPAGGADLDLHRLPVRCVPALAVAADRWWSGRSHLGGLTVPDPAAHALIIMLNLTSDGWVSWRHLIDLGHLASRFALPWVEWWQHLPAWRPLFATQAHLLHTLFGQQVALPLKGSPNMLAHLVARECLSGVTGRSHWPRAASARWLRVHAGWRWRLALLRTPSPHDSMVGALSFGARLRRLTLRYVGLNRQNT